MKVEERLLKPEPFRGDVKSVRAAEGERILHSLRSGDRLIAVDERGEQLTTEGLSEWVENAQRLSTRRLVFAVGGPYGHSEAVRQHSWRVMALSRMVVNHELARVMLAEQLYRVHTLLWGGSYHH